MPNPRPQDVAVDELCRFVQFRMTVDTEPAARKGPVSRAVTAVVHTVYDDGPPLEVLAAAVIARLPPDPAGVALGADPGRPPELARRRERKRARS